MRSMHDRERGAEIAEHLERDVPLAVPLDRRAARRSAAGVAL